MDLAMWFGILQQAILYGVASALVSGIVVGAALALLARIPVYLGILISVVAPGIGPLVLCIVAVVRSRNRHRSQLRPVVGQQTRSAMVRALAARRAAYLRRPSTVVVLLSGALIAAVMVATLFVRWFTVTAGGTSVLAISAWGTGLDALVIGSVVLVVIALVVTSSEGEAAGSAVVAVVGAWWAFVGAVALALSSGIGSAFASVNEMSLPVLDLLDLLGVDPQDISLDGFDLGAQNLDLGAILPDLRLILGPAWFMVLAAGLAALLWSAVIVIRAGRRNKTSDSDEPATDLGAPVSSGWGSSFPPADDPGSGWSESPFR